MNFNSRSNTLILSAFGVLIVAAVFYTLVGRGTASTWPGNAVYNWNHYGFGTLHGKLVTNPGGFEALTQPDIYKGHRAASFYPVFAVGKLLGWLGDSLLMFHLFFSVVLVFSVWFLLGRNPLATAGAWSAVLCPGYSVYPTVVDPNAMALYLMVPFAAVVVHFLSAKELPPWKLVLLAGLTFAYTSLNWSTAFGHGILFCALLVMPSISRSRLAIYAGLAGLSIGVIGSLSVLDKMSGGSGAAGGGSFLTFLAGYTWGHVGYGADLTTWKAIVRLSVVNSIGLLPLVVFFPGWTAANFRKASRRLDARALLPLLAAMLGVMTMRNYFGHHPWMAAPMLLPGLVLSLAVLFKRHAPEKTGDEKAAAGRLLLVGSLFYALVILGAQRAYHAGSLELAALVRQHTARTDIIVLVANTDPQMAAQAKTISESCDRRVVVLPDLQTPLVAGGNQWVLSSANLAGQLPVVAQSEKSPLLSLPLIRELSFWYAQKISRRGAQDRHFDFTANASFGLYRLPTPAH